VWQVKQERLYLRAKAELNKKNHSRKRQMQERLPICFSIAFFTSLILFVFICDAENGEGYKKC
jgi:hypothetical protein